MTITEYPKTIFENIHFIYSRKGTDFTTVRTQRFASVSSPEANAELKESTLRTNASAERFGIRVRESENFYFLEKINNNGIIVGVATELMEALIFDFWFVATMLTNAAIDFDEPNVSSSLLSLSLNSYVEFTSAAKKITEIFEVTLKHKARVDRWEEGKDAFIKSIEFFTSREIPVEVVLPAFPCKLSNHDKVASPAPDLGEELAVSKIIEFVIKLREVYPPGLKFYIVSDGHVFSDCINVDDDAVDRYTEHLIKVYHKVKPKGFEGVYFRGLNDCFESTSRKVVEPILKCVGLDHYLDTELDEQTELNRKVLMLACDDNASTLRDEIKTPGHPRLYLYRGFNKFMFEDLENTRKAQLLSGKKFKRMVASVAFEMIRRNDAYSNLVELIFPFHLRLSIHAHHNAGPKYGIRLLDPNLCTTRGHDKNKEDDLLHIPSPWHNAIFEIEGHDKLIVSHAKLAATFEQSDEYKGGWHDQKKCFVFVKA